MSRSTAIAPTQRQTSTTTHIHITTTTTQWINNVLTPYSGNSFMKQFNEREMQWINVLTHETAQKQSHETTATRQRIDVLKPFTRNSFTKQQQQQQQQFHETARLTYDCQLQPLQLKTYRPSAWPLTFHLRS